MTLAHECTFRSLEPASLPPEYFRDVVIRHVFVASPFYYPDTSLAMARKAGAASLSFLPIRG